MKSSDVKSLRRAAQSPTQGIAFRRPRRPMERVHCIAVNPRGEAGPAQGAACWFRVSEDAELVYERMSRCPQLERHTLERFELFVPAGASISAIDLLALSATNWGTYRAAVSRAARTLGDRLAASSQLPPRLLMLAHSVLPATAAGVAHEAHSSLAVAG